MKRKKWNSFSSSSSVSIFSARFRVYCPTEWMDDERKSRFPLYISFLEKIETHFYLNSVYTRLSQNSTQIAMQRICTAARNDTVFLA